MAALKKKPRINNGNYCVQFLFDEIYRTQSNEGRVAKQVGIERNTIRNWRLRTMPRVDTLEAALNHLGYRLTVEAME